MTAKIAETAGGDPPSANQMRRRLSAWYRGELRDRFGPINPPVANLPGVLRQLAVAVSEFAPRASDELERIVLDLIADASAREAPAV